MISKSTKVISIGGGDTIEVPDYTNRLAAMKLAMQAKGHLSEKTQGLEKAKKHIDYILK